MATEDLFNTFLENYSGKYLEKKFNSLWDYLVFLDAMGIFFLNECWYEPYFFSFEASSPSSIVGDCFSHLRKCELAGTFRSKGLREERDRELFLTSPDDVEENEEYMRLFEEDRGLKWIDKNDKERGVYMLHDYNRGHSKLIDDLKISIGFYATDNTESFLCTYLDDMGVTYDGFNAFEKVLCEGFTEVFINDINKILENVSTVRCSADAYSADNGEGTSYFLIVGYNPKNSKGEGFFMDCTSH